jgi:hypothetical protein
MGVDPELEPLREEVQQLVQKIVMNLADGLTGNQAPRRMKQIQDVSEIGRDLMMALGGPGVRRGGRRKKLGLSPIGGYNFDDDEMGYGEALSPISGLGGATAVETFGAKILQEGISSLPDLLLMLQAPNLIRAVKAARDANLDDVADELQRKLHDGLGLDFAKKLEATTSSTDPFGRDEVDPVTELDEEAA